MATMQDARTIGGKKRDDILSGQRLATLVAEIEDVSASSEAFAEIEERFRQIAARCLDTTRPARSQMLAVSSPTLGDGSSSIAIGLAVAAARNLGSDVLVIETDMQRPTLAHDFGTEAMLGLTDYLTTDIDLKSVLHETRAPKVRLLPAGRKISNPGPLLRSPRFEALMKDLRTQFRTVIIDAPPMLTSPHASVIAAQADGLVLVLRAGETHLHEAKGAIKAAGTTPLRGIVLNGTRAWLPGWLSRAFGVSRFDIE